MAGTGDKSALESMQKATDIDRRKCTREVPMEVLCLGLSRTGTLSLREALKQLGYRDAYHYSSLALENQRDCEMWNDAFKAKYENHGKPFGREEWDQLLGHCMATTDSPSVFFYRELAAAYPNTKLILTTRDSNTDAYYKSFMRTLQPFGERFSIPPPHWYSQPWRRIYQFLLPYTPFMELNYLLIKYGHRWDWPETGLQRYYEHNEDVRRMAREQGRELLEFEVGKGGWGPMCEFLGKEVPDAPFPRVNDTESFNAYWDPAIRAVDEVVMKRAAGIAAGACILGAAGAAWWMRWGR